MGDKKVTSGSSSQLVTSAVHIQKSCMSSDQPEHAAL